MDLFDDGSGYPYNTTNAAILCSKAEFAVRMRPIIQTAIDHAVHEKCDTLSSRIAELEAENTRLRDAIVTIYNKCPHTYDDSRCGTCRFVTLCKALFGGNEVPFVDDDPNDILTPENLAKHSCIEATIAFEKANPSLASGKEGEQRPTCPLCGNEIDPDTCCCGESKASHTGEEGHPFIPMGCECYRNKKDGEQ